MASIWTNGYHQKGTLVTALENGIIAAKQGEHLKAFKLFQEVYIGINWEKPQEDSELKYKALRLIGYAGFKGEKYEEAHGYFLKALEMGERLFSTKKCEEKERIDFMLRQCQINSLGDG